MRFGNSNKNVIVLCACGVGMALLIACQQAAVLPNVDSSVDGTVDITGNATASNGQLSESSEQEDTMNSNVQWLIYRDPQFGFSISYPQAYVLLPVEENFQGMSPLPVGQVRFLDRVLATADTAALEIPQATVEVLDNSARLALEQWLDTNEKSGTRTPVTVGKSNGYRVTLNTLMAPNEFIYFASDSYIYRLILLGPNSETMLQSFKIE